MLVKITQSNIKDGIAKNCWKCPISLAINAATDNEYKSIMVFIDEVRLHNWYTKKRLRLIPASIHDLKNHQDFVENFDEGKVVEPIEIYYREWSGYVTTA